MRKIPNELFFSRVEAEIAGGRPVRFRLKGWSMFPLLRDGAGRGGAVPLYGG